MELEAGHVDFWEADSAVEWGTQDLTEVWYKGVLVWSKPPALRTFTRVDRQTMDPYLDRTKTTEADGSAYVAMWQNGRWAWYAVYIAQGGLWHKLDSSAPTGMDAGMTGTMQDQFCVTFNYPGCDRSVTGDDKAIAFNRSGDFLVIENNPSEMNNGTVLDLGWPAGMTCRDVIGFTASDPNLPDPDGPTDTGVTMNETPAPTTPHP